LRLLALLLDYSADQEVILRQLAGETLREYRHSGVVQKTAVAMTAAQTTQDIAETLLENSTAGQGQAVIDRYGHVLCSRGCLADSTVLPLSFLINNASRVLLDTEGTWGWLSLLAAPLGKDSSHWLVLVSDTTPFTSVEYQQVSTVAAIASAALDGLHQREITGNLLRYFPRSIAQDILNNTDNTLGREYTATILFADICNFTPTTRALGARATVALLNQYFEEMVLVVRKHRGFVDKFLGDGLLAVFGIPAQPHHAEDALETARDMLEVISHIPLPQPLTIRTGISTGSVISGNIGSFDRLDYTVIGNPVNDAAKLLDISRRTGDRLLLTDETWKHLPHELQQQCYIVMEQWGDSRVYGWQEKIE
jgi:class 3 adenylate cyclase